MALRAVLQRLAESRGLPQSMTVDHGPELESQVLDSRAYQSGARLAFIRGRKKSESELHAGDAASAEQAAFRVPARAARGLVVLASLACQLGATS